MNLGLKDVANCRRNVQDSNASSRHSTANEKINVLSLCRSSRVHGFGGDFDGDFGDDFGSDFSNGFGGSDMFMSNMPTPTKTVKSVVTASSNSPDSVLTPPEPPASSTEKKEETVPVVAVDTGFGGFSFSMDEDF